MKALFYLATATVPLLAEANSSENIPFHRQHGYSVETLTGQKAYRAFTKLKSMELFQQMRGSDVKCKTIYHVLDSAGESVGYGATCTSHLKDRKHFFCWSASGKHFGYASEGYNAGLDWIADSVLHSCGGRLVTGTDSRKIKTEPHPTSQDWKWKLELLGWVKRRPVLTMLKSDITKYGFKVPLFYCRKTFYISRGWNDNTHYATICEIDEKGKSAIFCYDNIVGNFAMLTRYYDNPEWIENTIYRHCWAWRDSRIFF